MRNQPYTVQNQALQAAKKVVKHPPKHNRPQQSAQRIGEREAIPAPPQQLARRPRKKPKKRLSTMWLLAIPVVLFGGFLAIFLGGLFLVQLNYANKILPQVSVAGIDVGSLTQSEASNRLSTSWTQLTLTDGTSTYNVTTSDLGIQIDADASASRAFEHGHGTGGWIAFIQAIDVSPVITIDANQMNEGLVAVAPQINQVAQNAGVTFIDGQAQATEPIYGTQIDIQTTINTLQGNPEMIADGTLELMMQDVAPDITDATPLVAEAQALLSSPLDIRVFDPVTGDSIYWSVLSSTWSTWLTVTSDPSSPIGLALSVEGDSVRQYLQSQTNSTFDSTRTIDIDDAVNAVQNAFSNGSPQDATIVVQHLERTHTVQAGESITSIAWDYGIPYLYVIQANGGLESVSIGQQITIPAADTFISEEFNPNKRIVVSISQQRTYVYENGELLYEWVSSTGIDSSPTWTGVYQVISHVPNAYAENWNLYMPNFIGVYEPVPNSDFTNGFHGFPTRGGGQLLWENSLGRRVTYGCILLSDTHIAILYDWAEDGVIVEIRA